MEVGRCLKLNEVAGQRPALPGLWIAGQRPALPELWVAGQRPALPGPWIAGQQPALPGLWIVGQRPALPERWVAGQRPALPLPAGGRRGSAAQGGAAVDVQITHRHMPGLVGEQEHH